MATSAAATLCAAAPLARLRPPRPTPQPAPAPSTAAPCAAVLPRRRLGRLAAVLDRGSGSGGAGVLDRPDFETMGPGGGPQADDSGAKREGSGGRGLGGGSWRVLLLDSERHTEERVVQGITTVIPGADEAHAANCFHTVRGSLRCASPAAVPPKPARAASHALHLRRTFPSAVALAGHGDGDLCAEGVCRNVRLACPPSCCPAARAPRRMPPLPLASRPAMWGGDGAADPTGWHAQPCRSCAEAPLLRSRAPYLPRRYCQLLWQRSLKVGLEPDTTTL